MERKETIDKIIDSFIADAYYANIINEEKFYFEYLRDLFKSYIAFDISLFQIDLDHFTNNLPEKFSFQTLLLDNQNKPYYDLILLIGKMVSIFDAKGYNPSEWNPYQDKRRVSMAAFTQKNWTFCFLRYKLDGFTFEQINEFGIKYRTFCYAIEFISDPTININITSFNHRIQIKEYFNLSNEVEIINLFDKYTSKICNSENISFLITNILYHPRIKKLWLDEVIGLMASDSTGWQESIINKLTNHDTAVIWNSKKPSGTNETLVFLKNIIKEENTFNLYYCIGNSIIYKATIVDFVEDQKELIEKNWKGKYGNIADFEDDFSKYADNNKSARILFLVNKMEKLEDVSIDQFKFYKDFSKPRQDNISPIKYENLKVLTPINMAENNRNTINKSQALNQILFGPPGTGKTYHTINKALSIIENKSEVVLKQEQRVALKNRFDGYVKSGQIVFTTFHQSMSYEDFIEGIKPLEPDNNFVSYKVVPGIFKQICSDAALGLENDKEVANSKPYVLIIDEINRGNVSQIFGELITLIEDDKRLGKDEALKVTLPYSKDKFGVPPNLYIIGTMNTADRSVEALDTALRRRFSFIEMPPNAETIALEGINKGVIGDIDLVELLNVINKRIEKLLDKDHQIGHSFFMSIEDTNGLRKAFKNKIIPLLQEYFFGDYGKIGLVLGEAFITIETNDDDIFATFDSDNASDFSSRTIYRLVEIDEKMDIESAIKTLLKK